MNLPCHDNICKQQAASRRGLACRSSPSPAPPATAASIALLGRLGDKDENGRQEYFRGEDCLASLKDMQQFLYADDVAGDVFQPAVIIQAPGKDQGKAKARRVPWELHRWIWSPCPISLSVCVVNNAHPMLITLLFPRGFVGGLREGTPPSSSSSFPSSKGSGMLLNASISRRSIVEWNVLQNHIFPILVDHGEDPEILYESLVVLFLTTQTPTAPKILLDDDKDTRIEKWKVYSAAAVPTFQNLAIIKEQFAASDKVLAIIMRWLIEPLESGKDRKEEEIVVLDLVLQLIKNLLQMEPPVESGVVLPASIKAKLLAGQDALLIKFSRSHVLEMMMLLAQNVEDDENRNWNLLLLEIINLIFAKEEPTDLLQSYKVENGEWKQSGRRRELENRLTKTTHSERRQQHKMRHQRFTGVFSTALKNGLRFINTSAEGEQKLPERLSRGGLRRKAKVEVAERPAGGAGRNEVLDNLNEFAKVFIEVGFNSLIGTVVYDYEMESAALEKSDDHNFINVSPPLST